jgi:hypothetical protein
MQRRLAEETWIDHIDDFQRLAACKWFGITTDAGAVAHAALGRPRQDQRSLQRERTTATTLCGVDNTL